MHRLIEESDRKKVLHHQMLDNMFIAHHMILEDLEAWEKSNENSAPPTDQEVQNPAKRLCEKAQQRFPEDKECFETMVKISEEVEIGETNLFHCDQYEHYLRSLNRVAGLIGAETSKNQIDFFYLLPFDYPLSLPLDKKDDPDFEKKLREWDQLLFTWMHKPGDDYYGRTLKEDSMTGLFSSVNDSLNCHGQQQENINKLRVNLNKKYS
jgi:hypothetical protein